MEKFNEADGWMYVKDTFSSVNENSFKMTNFAEPIVKGDITLENALDIINTPSVINKSYITGKVLGTLEGCFFMPDGYSRNKRFYPELLWDNTLSKNEVISKLARGGMLGMFEHPESSSRETKDGIITSSHPIYGCMVTKVLKKVEQDGVKIGYGKSYILNTPIGNIINTLLSAKDEDGKPLFDLAVSTRAWAKTKGKDSRGNDIMDPNNYFLDNVDLVMDPGIPEAHPTYKSIESEIIKNITPSYESIHEQLAKELNIKYLMS